MNDAPVIALSPETVLGEMKKNGVSHVVWLPDSETIRLADLTTPLGRAEGAEKPDVSLPFPNIPCTNPNIADIHSR
jgi:hypothetical protein